MNKRTATLVSVLALGAAMFWGMLAQRNHWPPYQLVKGAYDLASPPPGGACAQVTCGTARTPPPPWGWRCGS